MNYRFLILVFVSLFLIDPPAYPLTLKKPGGRLNKKTVLPGMAIPMLKIRRPNGRLIFNMEITICR